MDKEDSGSEDVVITHVTLAEKKTEEAERGTGKTDDVDRAMDSSELPVGAKDEPYALISWTGGNSIVTVQQTRHEHQTQRTVPKKTVRMPFTDDVTLKCSSHPDFLRAMKIVCKNANDEEHIVQFAYDTPLRVRMTLLGGTMETNVWDTSQRIRAPVTCRNLGDTFTVTGHQNFKLGLHDTFKITHMPANVGPEGGAQKRVRGLEGGVGGSA